MTTQSSPHTLPTASHPYTLTTPAYGGDWNPEQWDADTIEEDIALMGEAGVTMITLGVFSWSRVEPSPGHYDLDWLGDIIDRLHSAGIAVDLATGTASPPAWMALTHPETLPAQESGARWRFGSRQQYCPSAPYYRERSAGLAEQLALRFGDHPGVALWHVGNEYACHVHECFCDTCAVEFRTWALARHGSLEAINAAWGTDFWSQRYTAIEQVTPPRISLLPAQPNPGQLLDWRRFCNRQVLDCMLGEIERLRAHSPRPITTNFMGAFPWLDYREWAHHLDIITDDHYPDPADPASAHAVAWVGDLMRGLGDGAPWMLMEQATAAVQWRPRNSPKRPGQFALWSLSRLAHGADAILQFQWRQSRQGAETFHSGMVPHAGKASRTWRDVVEMGEVLGRLGAVVGERGSAEVAVLIDWDSEWARMSAVGPVAAGAPFDAARQWHRSLWEAGIATDVVFRDSELSGYRVIVVPELFMDIPQVATALGLAAEGGAQVLVTGPTGVVTDTMEAVRGGYLGSLRELLGVRVGDHWVLGGPVGQEIVASRDQAVYRLSRVALTPGAQTWVGVEAASPALIRALDLIGSPAPDLRGGMWAEVVVPLIDEDDPAGPWPGPAEVVAVFDGRGGSADLAGLPAVTRNRVGEGAAWYVATDLDAISRAAVLKVIAAHARVRPVLDDLPDGVEAQQRGEIAFLLNHGDQAVEVSGVVGEDLLSGRACTGHVVLAPRSALVVAPN